MDGPFLHNEVVAWSRAYGNLVMIFKVDFQKAYDSISWAYLLVIMKIIGVGSVWCVFIMMFLWSRRALSLVNGSPTNEFQILVISFLIYPIYGGILCCVSLVSYNEFG